MGYKILHFSDLHLDASFAGQGFPIEYGKERRLDLRAALTRVLARARELEVNAITVGGDFFVQEYLLPETADFIQQQLALLSPIRVIIAPGGKDPYTNESPYASFNWSENVDIFYQGKLSRLELATDIHLWGACNPPPRGHKLFDGFQPANGVNILLMHGSMGVNNYEVHTISRDELNKAGFHCALLGGSHSAQIPTGEPNIIYPGSLEPLAPSEEKDLHQAVLIEIDGENIQLQSLSLQQWHYRTVEVDITNCVSIEEAAHLIDAVVEAKDANNPYSAVTVELIGKPGNELNISVIRSQMKTIAFCRLESYFELGYDLKQLAREQTVRGLLVQRFMERIKNAANDVERYQQLTALNFALQALDGKQVSLYETKAA